MTQQDSIQLMEVASVQRFSEAEYEVYRAKRQYLREVAGPELSEPALDRLSEHTKVWITKTQVEKYEGDWTAEQIEAGLAGKPYEVIERLGNLLMYGGASCLWECLMGNGTGTAAQTLTFFNNGNAYLGVGDSSTAAAATQTDLQAASNKLRKAMDASNPAHTDGTTSGAASIQFKSTFSTSDANFAWAEWGIFNGSSGGRMLNRKVESLGTKVTGTWVLTVTLTLA